MSNKRPTIELHAATNRIYKLLLSVDNKSGHPMSTVFVDWLSIVEATLRMRPDHILSYRVHGKLADEPKEIMALGDALHERYPRQNGEPCYFRPIFKQALCELEAAAGRRSFIDIIGELYIFRSGIAEAGRFLSDWIVAQLRVESNYPDLEQDVYENLRNAIKSVPDAIPLLNASDKVATASGDDAWFWYELMPLILPSLKRSTVYDSDSGTGAMLLTEASFLPRWMTEWGLVAIFGQEDDPVCRLISNINLMLYGLNGYTLSLKIAGGIDYRPKGVDWSAIYGEKIVPSVEHQPAENVKIPLSFRAQVSKHLDQISITQQQLLVRWTQ